MQFPYGIADFEKIRRQGYFYQDRTDRIRTLEGMGEQLLLLRPRRFGKSLWLSTLDNYYAIDRADRYYLGALTHAGRNAFGELQLVIPNLVIRKLYVERIRDALLGTYDDQQVRRQVTQQFYRTGTLAPLAEFIETRYFPVFDNRDLRWSNELVVKTAFLVTLFSDAFYIMDSEAAVGRGYADLSLILRPDRRQYRLLDHLLEFKTLTAKELGLNAEQLAATSRETLAAHPKVQAKLTEARTQLARYRVALDEKYGARLKLQTHAVVGIDLARLVWESSEVIPESS